MACATCKKFQDMDLRPYIFTDYIPNALIVFIIALRHVCINPRRNNIKLSCTVTLRWGHWVPGCLESDQGGSATPGKLKANLWHQGVFALCFGLFYDRQSQAMICCWLNTIWLLLLFINMSFQSRCHTNIGKLGGRGTMVAMETMGSHSNSDPYIAEHWNYQRCVTWVVRD